MLPKYTLQTIENNLKVRNKCEGVAVSFSGGQAVIIAKYLWWIGSNHC